MYVIIYVDIGMLYICIYEIDTYDTLSMKLLSIIRRHIIFEMLLQSNI